MKIVLIFRAKTLGFHSIENVFDSVREELKNKKHIESVYVEKHGFNIANLFTLRKHARASGPDVIYHVTGDIQYVVFALPRKRTILTIHDCVFIHKHRGLKGWILKKLYLDWPVRYVPLITTISEKTKNEVAELTRCNPNKIRVINNPVASHIYFTEKRFNTDFPTLLFVGSQANKNLNRIIESLRGFPCTLNIVGHIDKVQQVKLNQYDIRFVVENNLSNEQMAARYEQADIILFPSLYEGFGLPVIEGFKAGRAVLTSEISPMKELSDGAAWLVDPYSTDSIRDTLERIIRETETRKRKIQSGFRIVQQFLPENVALLYSLAYSELRSQNSITIASR